MAADVYEAAVSNGRLLGPIAALARQKKTWSPQLLAGVMWRGLTHLRAHRRVVELLKLPALAQTARSTPRFAFKYLTHDYLVRGLSTAERASCFMHHYRRMHDALADSLLRQILLRDVVLHAIAAGDHCFILTLGLSRDFDKEGEISLTLSVDGLPVFLMSFSIVPGKIVGAKAGEVLLISRVQGMKGVYQQVQLATKALHDVAPDALLFAALQGIAVAFGIGEIAAVTASRQSSFTADSSAEFNQAYDRFFQGLEIPQTPDGFFLAPVPVEGKPMAQIKKGHKIRTKQKRAFKQSVQSACADFLAQHMANPAPELPVEEPASVGVGPA